MWAFVGSRWVPLGPVGFRWVPLAPVGSRWVPLGPVGFRGVPDERFASSGATLANLLAQGLHPDEGP